MAKSLVEGFVQQLKNAGITHVTSVPDGYLAPLIEQVVVDDHFTHIPAAREEECIGIASGLAMGGKKPLVMMQNVGFLNSIGCFATLPQNYKIPFVVLVAHRGNLYDQTKYDVAKYRPFAKAVEGLQVFTASWQQHRDEKDIVKLCQQRAETASEPVLLLLDFPPQHEVAC